MVEEIEIHIEANVITSSHARLSRRVHAPPRMFSRLGLLNNVKCPDLQQCTRQPFCVLSHRDDIPDEPTLTIPVASKPTPSSSKSPLAPPISSTATTIPAKRPVALTPSPQPRSVTEPPRKLQRVTQSSSKPSQPANQGGPPVLRVNAAQSQVPIPVRQVRIRTRRSAVHYFEC